MKTIHLNKTVLIGLFVSQCILSTNHVIGFRDAGLFSNFLQILHHLHYCEKNELTPIVYWGKHSHYYDNNGWNNSTSDNVWEYFFEPVSSESYTPNSKINLNYTADSFEMSLWPLNNTTRIFAKSLIDKYIHT